jgi:hypothetical protein
MVGVNHGEDSNLVRRNLWHPSESIMEHQILTNCKIVHNDKIMVVNDYYQDWT